MTVSLEKGVGRGGTVQGVASLTLELVRNELSEDAVRGVDVRVERIQAANTQFDIKDGRKNPLEPRILQRRWGLLRSPMT